MKKKITRKGAGRKKGQLSKVKGRGLSPDEISKKAYDGEHRPDVLALYNQIRTLKVMLLRDENTEQAAREGLEWYLAQYGDRSTEVYRALLTLLNAFRKNDTDFFVQLAKTFEAMVENDAKPNIMPAPPADPDLFWLTKLAEFSQGEPIVMGLNNGCFPRSMVEVMRLPASGRPPLTLNQIQDYILMHTGRPISKSSASAKAKAVGIQVNGRFGHKRLPDS